MTFVGPYQMESMLHKLNAEQDCSASDERSVEGGDFSWYSDADDSSLDDDSSSDATDSSSDDDKSEAVAMEPEPSKPKAAGGNVFLSLEMVKMLCTSSSEKMSLANSTAVQNVVQRTQSFHNKQQGLPVRKGIVFAIQTESPIEAPSSVIMERGECPSPKELLVSILAEQGYSSEPIPHNSLSWVKGNVAAYSLELMTAVRHDDLATIRKLHAAGHNLQCSNRFQESLLHTVARRGRFDILKFLVNDAGVSMRVCCDQGRTMMHDAAWSETPNYECIADILEKNPDFLLISDKRGFTPLEYAPKSSWGGWNKFLSSNKELVMPKTTKLNPNAKTFTPHAPTWW
jgi:Ankyrin repeats (3 copies)